MQLRLPDFFALCPFEASTNPYYEDVSPQSSDWVTRHNVLTGKKHLCFILSTNEILVSHTYPMAGREQFRTCCDFVNLLFVIDEISDEQSGEDARETGMICVTAMKDDKWDDGSALAKMAREFKNRFLRHGSELCLRRFIKQFEDYIDAVAKEAEYRERDEILDMQTFTPLRRRNSAVLTCFALFEYAMGADLPDEVFENVHFTNMYWAACDMVCWSNDIYSYKMESVRGIHGNNVVSVLMKEKGFGIQAASDYIGEYYKKVVDGFLEDKAKLPSWGPVVDKAVTGYIKGMENWVIGSLEWSFESQRYFGAERDEVRKTLIVELLAEKRPGN